MTRLIRNACSSDGINDALEHVLTLITCLSDLGKPSKEQLALQMELRRLQSARQLDEEEFENQKQMLQAQLQSEVSDISASHRGCETVVCIFHVNLFHLGDVF